MKKRKERPYVTPRTPVTVWGRGNVIRVYIKSRVVQIPGVKQGRIFTMSASKPLHWGLGGMSSGAWLTKAEHHNLMERLVATSKQSPWLKVRVQ